MFSRIAIICVFFAIANGQFFQQQVLSEDPEPEPVKVKEYDFDCRNKNGYFADVSEKCQVYHVCQSPDGSAETTLRHSFNCPEGTFFNQELLTCAHETDCGSSQRFYDNQNSHHDSHQNSEQFPQQFEQVSI